MSDIVLVITLGFLLGVRHATDADHVVAITTIVSRQREIVAAMFTGLLWGVGHTLTLVAVGSGIILFNLVVSYRAGVAMELSVAAMLMVLGGLNIGAYLRPRRTSVRGPTLEGPKIHEHGRWGSMLGPHMHGGVQLPSHSWTPRPIDRRFWRPHVRGCARPIVVGVVHGLAGSAAVTLLVVATVRDPGWAIAYLLVFGLGTIAGMMLITMSIASALRLAGGGPEIVTRRFGLAFGAASVVFGVTFAYRVWTAAAALPFRQ